MKCTTTYLRCRNLPVVIRLSFRIRKNTFVVLDNASVHRCKLMRELRPVWEKHGLFLFFLPPYSPHLKIPQGNSTGGTQASQERGTDRETERGCHDSRHQHSGKCRFSFRQQQSQDIGEGKQESA